MHSADDDAFAARPLITAVGIGIEPPRQYLEDFVETVDPHIHDMVPCRIGAQGDSGQLVRRIPWQRFVGIDLENPLLSIRTVHPLRTEHLHGLPELDDRATPLVFPTW